MEKCNKILSRRNVLVIGITVVLLVCLGAAISGVSAKYVKNVPSQDAVVKAREFYFTSDLLKENYIKYTLNPGTGTVSFTLQNYGDDLRYSESDISCELEVKGGPDGKPATVSSSEEVLLGGEKSSTTITLSNLQDGNTYTVTVTGIGGYEKKLSAQFEILSPSTNVYKYVAADPSGAFLLLTVWTENVSGPVSIQFPAGLIPDETNPALSGIHNYQDGTYVAGHATDNLNVYSSQTYRFFLETPFTAFSSDQFTVTVDGNIAEPGTPT